MFADSSERVQHLADRPVYLRYEVAVGAEVRPAVEVIVRGQRQVRGVQRKVEEERIFVLPSPFDEGDRFLGQAVENLIGLYVCR